MEGRILPCSCQCEQERQEREAAEQEGQRRRQAVADLKHKGFTAPAMREMKDERYGGAFLEFGSYTLLPIFKLLGCRYEDVTFQSIQAPNGIDLYTKIHFRFKDGLALSKTGVGVKSEGQLVIGGTNGYILAPSPWWLTRSFEVRFEDPGRIEKYSPKFLGDGLRYEIAYFVSKINGDTRMSYCLTQEESIAMAGVVERFMEERRRQRVLPPLR